jgi:hypothetical protein
MLKNELIQKSPIRVFEKSIHGGLGKGNLGVITARKGVGKTACLAHVAIDKMLCGQYVLHISFADDPSHIRTWYRQVFDEVANQYKLEHALDVFDELVHHRLIMHFKQQDVTFEQMSNNIRQVEEGTHFKPEIIIVDGCDFEEISEDTLKKWKQLAVDQDAAIWFAAVLHRENLQLDDRAIPAPVNRFADLFSVIIMLEPIQNYINMRLLKDHDSTDLEKLHLKLDPKTLLISNHRI